MQISKRTGLLIDGNDFGKNQEKTTITQNVSLTFAHWDAVVKLGKERNLGFSAALRLIIQKGLDNG